jgi:hypothetical protein
MSNAGAILSWNKAAGLAVGAVYGPFVVMALYTLAFVKCGHCKKAVWTLMPSGPGLLPMELGRRALNVTMSGEWVGLTSAFGVAVLMVWGLAWVVRQGPRARRIGLGIGMVIFSLAAFAVLSMIRA